jgi:hypothetical protein
MSVKVNLSGDVNSLKFSGTAENSNDFRNKLYGNAKYLNHTKWEGTRSGIWSVNDKSMIERATEEKLSRLGNSVIQFQLLDEKGGPLAYHPYNHEGRTIYSDGNGIIKIHSAQPLEDIKRKAEEKRQYLEKIIDYASSSDDAASYLLGVDCATVLGKGKGAEYGVEKHILWADARPSVVQNYDPSGELFANALTKFRAVFSNANINITGLETTGEKRSVGKSSCDLMKEL